MYQTTDEFMDTYTNGTLSEFNNLLYEDYIELNFDSEDLFDYNNIDIQYKDGCDCLKDNKYYEYYEDYEDYEDCKTCNCGNDINYWNDTFMLNKIPMFPKNMKYQKYYEKIFPKRIYKNKIFYYLPYDCKYITTSYIDKTIIDTFDIMRSIVYIFIDDKLVLVEDCMSAWFGSMFNNFHTPESMHFDKYIDKLKEYELNNKLEDDNDLYYKKIIKF